MAAPSIPRSTVALALGLPADTDALPSGDLPLARFADRFGGYLTRGDVDAQAEDSWTGVVMDHLIATKPALALAVIQCGLVAPDAAENGLRDALADALADLGEAGHRDMIANAAEEDPALAALIERANAAT